MPVPVSPSSVKQTIPSPSGSFCEKFLNALRLPGLIYQAYVWAFNEDGSLSDDAIAAICEARCECSGSTAPPDDPPDVTLLAKPQNVAATDGTELLKIVVTWSTVPGADTYEVWRAPNYNDFSRASLVGTSVGTSFEDTNVLQQQLYFYWIRAKASVSMTFSPYSDPDSGYAQPNAVNGEQIFTQPGNYQFRVPSGVTAIHFYGIAGGGGGGGAAARFQSGILTSLNAGGGGGGAGGGNTVMSIPVSPLENLTVVVGAGGGVGVSRRLSNQPSQGSNGGNGTPSAVYRNTDGSLLASAAAGGGGAGGIVGGSTLDSIVDGGGGSGGSGTAAGTSGMAGAHSENGFQSIGGSGGFPTTGGGLYGIGGRGAAMLNGTVVPPGTAGTGGFVRLSW